MVEYGVMSASPLKQVPINQKAAPNQTYRLKIETQGIPEPDKAIQTLVSEIPKNYPVTVTGARVTGPVLELEIKVNPTPQIVGSSEQVTEFSFAGFLPLIPMLLGGIGIIVTLISLFLVMLLVPGWVFGLMILGAGISLLGYYISKTLK